MALKGSFHGVTVDGAKLARVMMGPNGPGMRACLEAAEKVKDRAVELCGYDDSPDRSGSEPHLRDTIVKRVVDGGGEKVEVQVGTEHPRALWHHEGTEPHVIEGNPLLVFMPKGSATLVFARRVNHPGTQPNRFLSDALDVLPTGWHLRK